MKLRKGTAAPAPRFCENCGQPLERGAVFCAGCGTKVEALPEAPAASAVVAGVPVAQPKPVRPPGARRGALGRGVRIALAVVVALVVTAAVGLWPQYSGMLPALEKQTADRAEASTWLSDGPDEPVVFTRRPVWATPDALRANPDAYQQRIVLISGAPVSASAEGTLSVATFEGDGKRVVVGYPGGRVVFSSGRPVTVAGVVSPTGDELLALAVSPGVPGDRSRNSDLALLMLAAAGAFALAATFVRVRRGINRRSLNRRALAAAAVVVSLMATMFLGGCEIVIHTSVNRDGSGTVNTRVITGTDSMEELMGLPNADAFIESWIASQEQSGLTVDRTANQLKVDRSFSSLEEFGAGSDAMQGSWSRLGSVDLPDGRHVFFMASFETSTVYPDSPEEGADTTAYDKLREEIDASTLRYELELPGTVLGANSDSAGVWEIPMGGRRFLFSESLTGTSDADSRLVAAQRVWEGVVRWLFAIAAGLAVFGLCAYPWRMKGGESRG